KPAAWLVKNKGEFAGHVAVFTAGGNDPGYVAAAQRSADLAQAAGFAVTLAIVPGAGHVVDAIRGGLPRAFNVLYPRLGLRAP
ncbi:MAG: esterase, partial [Actinobacteria bacterium]|nr:esterase [Actinomycetota bacterium]